MRIRFIVVRDGIVYMSSWYKFFSKGYYLFITSILILTIALLIYALPVPDRYDYKNIADLKINIMQQTLKTDKSSETYGRLSKLLDKCEKIEGDMKGVKNKSFFTLLFSKDEHFNSKIDKLQDEYEIILKYNIYKHK
ncbi:hypothetical protein P9865_05840 [Clostridium sporogenes]|nr:hypothetical protein [Clostridium sporogenes]